MAMRTRFGWLASAAIGLLITAGAPHPAAQNGNGEEEQNGDAPYLKQDRDIRVFDPSEVEKLGPLQDAARQLSTSAGTARSRPSAISNLVTYDYTLTTTNFEEAVASAQVRALKAGAARLYFDRYFLVGRDLLEPYLRRNGNLFVARTEILDRRLLAENNEQVSVRVSVNLDALFEDLRAKRFIAEPNRRPVVAVMLNQVVEGEALPNLGGRQLIERTMQRNLVRVNTRQMTQPPIATDLTASEELMRQARLEAQRHDVDVLITGTLDVKPIEDEAILYEQYDFMEATVTLSMVRVDTGEVIEQTTDKYSAANPDRQQAIQEVLDVMLTRVSQDLSGSLRHMWENTMLDKGHYRLMFNNVTEDELVSIRNVMRTLSPDLEYFVKAYYGDVLVVNLLVPDKQPEELEAFLRESNEPQFRVEKIDSHHYQLETL